MRNSSITLPCALPTTSGISIQSSICLEITLSSSWTAFQLQGGSKQQLRSPPHSEIPSILSSSIPWLRNLIGGLSKPSLNLHKTPWHASGQRNLDLSGDFSLKPVQNMFWDYNEAMFSPRGESQSPTSGVWPLYMLSFHPPQETFLAWAEMCNFSIV